MNKNTMDSLVKTIVITLAIFVVLALIVKNQSEKEPYVPSYDERTDEPTDSKSDDPFTGREESSSEPASNHITAFEFPSYTNFTIDISVGNKESGSFEVVGTGDFDPDDIEFVSSNESVAIIEFDEYRKLFGDVYYTITPISDGTATLYVQTKDGAVRSKEITVSVTDPNNFSYEIVDIHYNMGMNSIGNTWIECYAIVENTGNTNIYLSSGSFDIENESGNLIDVIKSVSVYPNVIAPGERAVYHENTTFDEHNEKIINIVPHVNVMRATVPLVRYEVSDVTLSEDKYGDITVVGRVTNHTELKETLCWIAIFLYNRDNKLIAIDTASTAEDLAPGGTSSFKTSQLYDYFGVDLEDVARYEIIAYPYQYQYNFN